MTSELLQTFYFTHLIFDAGREGNAKGLLLTVKDDVGLPPISVTTSFTPLHTRNVRSVHPF